jgi:hypothetical protein
MRAVELKYAKSSNAVWGATIWLALVGRQRSITNLKRVSSFSSFLVRGTVKQAATSRQLEFQAVVASAEEIPPLLVDPAPKTNLTP